MNQILKIKDLSYSVDNNKILDNVNIEIPEGAFVSILGPNGAGKTTFVQLISKLLNNTSGSIFLKNKNIKSYSRKELAKEMAYVSQNISADSEFKVEDVVLLGRLPYLGLFSEYNEKDYTIATNALEKVGITHLKDRYINTLSGGERQLVFIARAIAQNSGIIILDEPISNLDISHQIQIMDLLEKLNNEEKITILCVVHDMNIALRYTKHSILFNKNGNFVKSGTSKEIINKENIQEIFNIKTKIVMDNENSYIFAL